MTEFKVSMSVSDVMSIVGNPPNVIIAIDLEADVPTLVIAAEGFSADTEGAEEVADMLRDASRAIRKELRGKDDDDIAPVTDMHTPRVYSGPPQLSGLAARDGIKPDTGYKCPMVGCDLDHSQPEIGKSIWRHFDKEHIEANKKRQRPHFNPQPRGK